MSNSYINNYFVTASVSTTTLADCPVSWTFASTSIVLINSSTTAKIYYSFDGVNVGGIIDPAVMSGLVLDNISVSKIWFALATAGSVVDVYFEAYVAG